MSKTGRLYIGVTKDLGRRIEEHVSGKTKSIRYWKDLRLIYYEAFVNKIDANRREKYLKSTKGKRGLKLILRDTLHHGPIV